MYSHVPVTRPDFVICCASSVNAFEMPKSLTFASPTPVGRGCEQDVVGLEVAVNDAEAMRRLQSGGDLGHQPGRSRGLYPPLPLEQGAETLARHQLHGDEGPPVLGLAEIVDLNHVRVVDLGGVRGLPAEAGERVQVAREVAPQQLDGRRTLQPNILRLEHLPHAAGAEPLGEEISLADDAAEHVVCRGGTKRRAVTRAEQVLRWTGESTHRADLGRAGHMELRAERKGVAAEYTEPGPGVARADVLA